MARPCPWLCGGDTAALGVSSAGSRVQAPDPQFVVALGKSDRWSAAGTQGAHGGARASGFQSAPLGLASRGRCLPAGRLPRATPPLPPSTGLRLGAADGTKSTRNPEGPALLDARVTPRGFWMLEGKLQMDVVPASWRRTASQPPRTWIRAFTRGPVNRTASARFRGGMGGRNGVERSASMSVQSRLSRPASALRSAASSLAVRQGRDVFTCRGESVSHVPSSLGQAVGLACLPPHHLRPCAPCLPAPGAAGKQRNLPQQPGKLKVQ